MATQQYDKITLAKVKPNTYFTDPEFCEKASALVAQGKNSVDGRKIAAKELDVSPTQAIMAALVHDNGGLIGYRNDKEFGERLVQARDEGQQGWAVVGARLGGLSEGAVQKVYEQVTGRSAKESVLRKKATKAAPKEKSATPKASTKKEV